ncbi:MAG: PhoPQ-activated pathogenicity-related family protein [Pirellulales bacterium]|nr:PhoPQ-activated pathogenicity-related family protein [Pirellulales bacterium]
MLARAWATAALVLVALLQITVAASAQETALDRYLAQPDPVFAWKLVSQSKASPDVTAFVLELTSQTWRSAAEVDRPVWKHWLTIARPDKPAGPQALLFIGGGNHNDAAPTTASERVIKIAQETGTVAAELGMVPNQPLRFSDSPERARVEDDLIAYSRIKYMTTGDETWLVRLAMVKSGHRAIDAVQQFLASDAGGKHKIDQFVVAGGSKRGWTTWLVGATDPRVIAIVPLVIDALNSEEITRHHFMAYGFFSPALNDYVEHGLFPGKIGTPEYRAVLDIEDPYVYRHRERLRIPKFLINAAGDEFFLPDNSQFYYAELPQEKHLRYVPNAKHSLAGSDARESLQAFYDAVIHGQPRPQVTWQKPDEGTLIARATAKPSQVLLWQATNPDARDFRLDKIGAAWKSQPIAPSADGSYTARVAAPPKGYTAFFVEFTFPSGGRYPFKFTTEVRVVPDVLPYTFPTPAAKAN